MSTRVAIILPDLRLGGGQRVLLGLARQFTEYGQALDVVSIFEEGELVSELPIEGRYYPLLPGHMADSPWRGAKALLALIRYIRLARPDIVLSSMTGTNLLVAAACKIAGKEVRLFLREAASFANLRSRFFPPLIRLLYRRADALIAVSKGVANDLVRVGLDSQKIHVIQNPVDADRLHRMALEPTGMEEKLDDPYIISIGRLVAQKDHETLLRAYAISQSKRRYMLTVVGGGELECCLMRVAKELDIEHRIRWLGALPNPYGILSKASLFVLSSRWEGYPNVLLEAVALGIPVVSTDCPSGPREILMGGRFGRLAPVGDYRALAHAIDEELLQPSLCREELLLTHQMKAVTKKYISLMGIPGMEAGR